MPDGEAEKSRPTEGGDEVRRNEKRPGGGGAGPSGEGRKREGKRP